MEMPDADHMEILQTIEAGVVRLYGRERAFIDMDVLDAYDALVRRYSAEENGRSVPVVRLAERPGRIFAAFHLEPGGRAPGISRFRQRLRRVSRPETGRSGSAKRTSTTPGW